MKLHIILAGLCASALMVYMGGVDASGELSESNNSSTNGSESSYRDLSLSGEESSGSMSNEDDSIPSGEGSKGSGSDESGSTTSGEGSDSDEPSSDGSNGSGSSDSGSESSGEGSDSEESGSTASSDGSNGSGSSDSGSESSGEGSDSEESGSTASGEGSDSEESGSTASSDGSNGSGSSDSGSKSSGEGSDSEESGSTASGEVSDSDESGSTTSGEGSDSDESGSTQPSGSDGSSSSGSDSSTRESDSSTSESSDSSTSESGGNNGDSDSSSDGNSDSSSTDDSDTGSSSDGDGENGCNNKGGPKNRKIGETCTPDLCHACADENAVCVLDCDDGDVSQYVCKCDQGYEVGDECGICVESPKECTTDDDCPEHKVCVEYECVCRDDLLLAEDGNCYGTEYKDPCSDSYDICSASQYLICDNGLCNYQCIDPCEEDHMSCQNGECTCDSPYIQVGQVCVGTTYNDPCITPYDTCSESENLICSGDTCDCNPSSYIWDSVMNMCVGQDVCDDVCSSSYGCSDPNAECSDKCVCNQPYENVDCMCVMVASIPAHYGEACDDTHICVDPNNVCNGTTCVCNNNSVYDSSLEECVILLNAPCESENDTCQDRNASCYESICGFSCQCPDGFVPENPDVCGGKCVNQSTEGEPCNDSIKNICRPIESIECVNGTCRSNFNYFGEECECGKCVPGGNMYCNLEWEIPVCECLNGNHPSGKLCAPDAPVG